MRIVKQIVLPLVVMGLVSVMMLIGVSVLTYINKWQADMALGGITITYIMAGFTGGRAQKRLLQTTDMGRKLVEGIFLGVVFMGILVLVSLVVTNNGWSFSSRFFMIGMLIIGGTCLGRIL